jgi:hypothetical protein
MQQMMIQFIWEWLWWMWKILELNYKKWLHGEINRGKGGRNGRGHVWDNGKLKMHVKTTFASKVIMFEETLEFKTTIILCYGK